MASVYGMLGGAGADATYDGSYNITPTTNDITLATRNTSLEGDLTIQGDSDLVAGNINYGKSVFGVDGSYLALHMGEGQGTAYVDGVISEGDVIRGIEEKQELVKIGEMPLVEDKYPYYSVSGRETIVSSWGKKYITLLNSNSLYYVVYNYGAQVAEIDIANKVEGATKQTVSTVDVFSTVDIENGNLWARVIATLNNSDYVYIGLLKVQIENGQATLKDIMSVPLDDYTAWGNIIAPPHIYGNYVSLAWFGNDEYQPLIRVWDKNTMLSYFGKNLGNDDISIQKGLNYSVVLSENLQDVYFYKMSIQGSAWSSSYDDFVRVNIADNKIVSKRSVKQSDLDITGKLTDEYIPALAYFIDNSNNVYLYYSNQEIGISDMLGYSGKTYLAKFNTNMGSKISDSELTQAPSFALYDKNVHFYFKQVEDTSATKTILLYSQNAIIRVSLSGYIYSYKQGINFQYICPYVLNNEEVDYCYGESNSKTGWVEGAFEDTSALKTLTITTDTYTAELEEV